MFYRTYDRKEKVRGVGNRLPLFQDPKISVSFYTTALLDLVTQ